MKTLRWWLIGGVGGGAAVLVLVLSNLLPLHGRGALPAAEPERDQAAAVTVTVAPVTARNIQRTVDVVGTFEGIEDVTITPKVSGRVVGIQRNKENRPLDMGDIVHTGDPLLEIDPTDFRLAVDEALTARNSELAKLGLTEMPGAKFDVNDVPNILRTKDLEENAARRLERGRGLLAAKAISREDFEQLETDYRVAQANRRQAVVDALAILAEARQKDAQLATARQHLEDTHLVVPPLGTAAGGAPVKAEYYVAERMVSEGETINVLFMTKGVFRLVVDTTLKLLATVPERYVGQVKTGQKVNVTVEAYPGRVFPGIVSRVSPTVDRTNRTFHVEVLVPNAARELKPGGFAKLAVLTGVDSDTQTIPVEALVSFAGINKVFIVRDGKAHAVTVTPGAGGRGWVEVRATVPGQLPSGGRVVTSGQTQLAEGTSVRVRETEEGKN